VLLSMTCQLESRGSMLKENEPSQLRVSVGAQHIPAWWLFQFPPAGSPMYPPYALLIHNVVTMMSRCRYGLQSTLPNFASVAFHPTRIRAQTQPLDSGCTTQPGRRSPDPGAGSPPLTLRVYTARWSLIRLGRAVYIVPQGSTTALCSHMLCRCCCVAGGNFPYLAGSRPRVRPPLRSNTAR
jgi:hypothetical protein